jgi:hypothetical protein
VKGVLAAWLSSCERGHVQAGEVEEVSGVELLQKWTCLLTQQQLQCGMQQHHTLQRSQQRTAESPLLPC